MRTRAEIDKEYAVLAQIYGDRVFKGSVIQNEIKQLHEKMQALSQEPSAPHAMPVPEIVDVQKKNEPPAAENGPVDQPS